MENNNCIFCKIIQKEINSKIVFENDSVLVFEDISPQAPIHWLIIPKTHVKDFSEAAKDGKILVEIGKVVEKLTEEKGISNYRLVTNKGEEAGQTVFHFHVHLLAGRKMEWPPG